MLDFKECITGKFRQVFVGFCRKATHLLTDCNCKLFQFCSCQKIVRSEKRHFKLFSEIVRFVRIWGLLSSNLCLFSFRCLLILSNISVLSVLQRLFQSITFL
jgi:hypothetical protein